MINWSFGIVNNKLAEVYFRKKNNKVRFIGHCYVKKEEYKTKTEQKWIKEDIKNLELIYRKKTYKETDTD